MFRVRKAREISDVLEVFLGIFVKAKENKVRVVSVPEASKTTLAR